MQIDTSNYEKFYNVPEMFMWQPFKVTSDDQIETCIRNTAKTPSYVSEKEICVFNPDSFNNYVRRYDNEVVYLSEAERQTYLTSVFEYKLKEFYFNEFSALKLLSNANNRKIFCKTQHYHMSLQPKIYGVVMMQCIIVERIMKIDDFTNAVSRYAHLMGYNYVDSQVTIKRLKLPNGKLFNFKLLKIQFEASYVDGASIKSGDFIYHVAPRSLQKKILTNGLICNCKCTKNMVYPPRVYCFIDNNRALHKMFMANNDKHSKKFIKNDDLFDEFKNWYDLMQLKQTGHVFDTNEYAVFEINTAKIKKIKFYCDNLFFSNGKFQAVYSYQNIPPSCIKKIGEFCLTPYELERLRK